MAARAADPMTKGSAAQRVSFYFAPHQDDWQLFMNPSAFQDVVDADTKTVFIRMTAGDYTGSGSRKHPLYLGRENGAEVVIRFMADSDGRPPSKRRCRHRPLMVFPSAELAIAIRWRISYACPMVTRRAPATSTPAINRSGG